MTTPKDKIVQQAFVNVILDSCEKEFYPLSYAYRPHKGHLKAIRRIKHQIEYEKDFFFVTGDIKKFFDEIDHEIILNIFKNKITDEPNIIRLIQLWIKIGKVYNKKIIPTNRGLQQGFVISPILANLYLTEFDFLWKNESFNYLRYADNFLFSGKKSLKLEKALTKAKIYLQEKRKLSLNLRETGKSDIETGFSFLGVFFQKDTLKIAPKKMKKARNKIFRITNNPHLNIEQKIEKINNATYSWRYYYKDITDLKQLQVIDYWIVSALKGLGFTAKHRNSDGKTEKCRNSGVIPKNSDRNIQKILNRISFLSSEINAVKNGSLTFPSYQIEKKKPISTATKSVKNSVLTKQRFYKKKYSLESEILIIKSGSSLHLKNDSLYIKTGYSSSMIISLTKIKAILISSTGISLTTNLLKACSNKNIPLFITDPFGKPITQILPAQFSYMELMELQISSAIGKNGLKMSKKMILGKIINQRNIVSYYAKYWNEKSEEFRIKYQIYKNTANSVIRKIKTYKYSKEIDYRNVLMGYEGTLAAIYWEIFRILISPVPFTKRTHQHSKDKVNIMLNYGYGILYHRMTKTVIQFGLNPCIGYLHKSRKDTPVIVFDLIEQFRPVLVDRVVISMLNLKQEIIINKNGMLDEKSRKKLAENFLERLHDRFTYHGKDTSLADQIEERVKLLIKELKGKDNYKPFLWDA